MKATKKAILKTKQQEKITKKAPMQEARQISAL